MQRRVQFGSLFAAARLQSTCTWCSIRGFFRMWLPGGGATRCRNTTNPRNPVGGDSGGRSPPHLLGGDGSDPPPCRPSSTAPPPPQFLHVLLWRLPRLDAMLVQTPPAVPLLVLAHLVCWLRGTCLVIDWHNLGFTLLEVCPAGPMASVVWG